MMKRIPLAAAAALTLVTAVLFDWIGLPLLSTVWVVFVFWYLVALLMEQLWQRRKKAKPPIGFCLLIGVLVGIGAHNPTAFGQQFKPTPLSDEPSVVCAASSPVVYAPDTVTVTAWIRSDLQATTTWRAEQGTLSDSGKSVAKWTLERVPPERVVRATAEVRTAGGVQTCDVSVLVAGRNTMSQRFENARLLLAPGEPEDKGYGLYTYLLLVRQPATTSEDELAKSAFESWIRLAYPVADLKKYFQDNAKLNAMHVFVKTVPGDDVLRKKPAEIGTWIVDQYDALRAGAFAKAFARDDKSFLFLVSSDSPLTVTPNDASTALWVDLSDAPREVAANVVRHYVTRASSGRDLKGDRIFEVAYVTRRILGVVATELPNGVIQMFVK